MSKRVPRGRGQRPGTDTKTVILEAALDQFASIGYDRTTVRAIAKQADVDPALIYHYFDTKHGLLEACIRVPDEAAEVIAAIDPGESSAEELLTRALTVWNQPAMRKRLTALLRVSVGSPEGQKLYTDLIRSQLIEPAAAKLTGPDAQLRATLAASHAIGIAFTRFVFELEPLASADDAEVARLASRALDAYLQAPDNAKPRRSSQRSPRPES
jgi:AcrR family transcriptional regulator